MNRVLILGFSIFSVFAQAAPITQEICVEKISRPSFVKKCQNSIQYSTLPTYCPEEIVVSDYQVLDQPITQDSINHNLMSGFDSGKVCRKYRKINQNP